jgi:hypothetical protein
MRNDREDKLININEPIYYKYPRDTLSLNDLITNVNIDTFGVHNDLLPWL